MKIRYSIETDYPDYPNLPFTCETRKRSDAAADALWRAIYAMIEGQGLLDRPIAWKLKNEFEACEISPPGRGYYRLQRFTLGSERVTFRAEYI
jgi:hypothetical protein